MSVARFVVIASAHLIAPPRRGIFREAWLADLRDSASADVGPVQIAIGAVLTALSPHNLRELLQHAPNGRNEHVKEHHKTQARLALLSIWTIGAALAFSASLSSFPTPSGSGPQFTFPGGVSVWFGPVAAGVTAAAVLLGVVGIVLERRRLARDRADAATRSSTVVNAHASGDLSI